MRYRLAALAALAFTLARCGGDSSPTAPPQPTPEPTAQVGGNWFGSMTMQSITGTCLAPLLNTVMSEFNNPIEQVEINQRGDNSLFATLRTKHGVRILTGTVTGSEVVLFQPADPSSCFNANIAGCILRTCFGGVTYRGRASNGNFIAGSFTRNDPSSAGISISFRGAFEWRR